MKEIRKAIYEPLDHCEKCDYDKGFHVILEPVRFSDQVHVNLKCPGCDAIYDVGWTVKLET